MDEIKVGDTVGYITFDKKLSPDYYGIVQDIKEFYYTIEFIATEENGEYPLGWSFGTSQYPKDSVKKIEPYKQLTTDEKVLRKSKRLWNESKFVKNNPSLAY